MYIVTIDNWSMKKNFLNLFIVLLTAGVGLGLTACSSDEESVENVNTEPTKEPAEVQASCVEDTALNEAGQNAVGMVVGKWRLTKVGIDDYTETETYSHWDRYLGQMPCTPSTCPHDLNKIRL